VDGQISIIQHFQPIVVIFDQIYLKRRFQAAPGRMTLEALSPGISLNAFPGQIKAQLESFDRRIPNDLCFFDIQDFG
jgi:hypothetical protein